MTEKARLDSKTVGEDPMLSSQQIRSSFIEFFKQNDHTFVPSSPIVPVGDQSLLFTNAGMNQFKDIFLGLRPADCRRAVNSQKCLRVSGKHNDLEEVGKDTYHHTFFEMLGNWSFNDYFKAEAIQWAWQLLTEVWKIDPDRLWATVFAGDADENLPADEEAAELWKKLTPIAHDRILAFGKKDNFWEMGEAGPCGPCSEIHIDLGPEACNMRSDPDHRCRVNGSCDRFIELWNLVFIQFNRLADGRLEPLSARYVDTGAGLERVVAVLQNKSSNYDTDLFMPIIERTAELTGRSYTGKLGNAVDNAFRVIADHIRALTFAITDGAIPSNEGRGYVIRRILRRAARFGRELDMHQPFLYKLVPVVGESLGRAFPEITQRAKYVATVIQAEEAAFGKTLDRGIEIFNQAADKALAADDKTITGQDAFQLYDTYGFPLDLTQLMAAERGLKVDTAGFEELMEQQRRRARAAQKTDSLLSALADTELPGTDDSLKYQTDSCQVTLLGWIDENGFHNHGRVDAGSEVALVLDKTCFYAEAGGQVGDRGTIQGDGAVFSVQTTSKIAECVLHKGKLESGTLQPGQRLTATVHPDRQATKKNHTATHLLQWALREVLGAAVSQQGSYVGPDYLRFDFTCPVPPEPEQLQKVEQLIREKIAQDLPVTWTIMPKEQAQKLGAIALFGEKYGADVRVVALGAPDEKHLGEAFSCEFCGGTHVDRLGQIGSFKILREESVSAGVRRITAVTGPALMRHLETAADIVEQLTTVLQISPEVLVQRVTQLVQENKKLAKQLKSATRVSPSELMAQAKKLLDSAEKLGETYIVTGTIPFNSAEQARAAIDMLRKKAKSAAVVLGYEDQGKAILLAGLTEDLIAKGLQAGQIIKRIAPTVDGGGGGRPQMAQAGGKNPAKIPQALAQAVDLIKQKLQSS